MELLKKHTLYIGLLDKDTKTQLVSTPNAKTLINKTLGDCTISDATGYYTHEDGTQVVEPSLRVELLFKQDKEVFDACSTIKKELNQESIAISVESINSMLF